MKNKIIQNAMNLYKKENYLEALNLYLDAEEIYGYALFYANIILCIHKLKFKNKYFKLKRSYYSINEKHLSMIKKSRFFDQQWYSEKNSIIKALGIDPAEHYYRYGLLLRLNPGPSFNGGFYIDTHPGCSKNKINPLIHHLTRKGFKDDIDPSFYYTLWAAHRVALSGQQEEAAVLATKYLPPDLAYTANLLHANLAISQGNEQCWLKHLNNYLAHFNISPITLDNGKSIIERFSAHQLPYVNNGPLISVIMPAWNAEKYIKAAVYSILRQTWRNLELLIIDDASEDGTWTILQELASYDKRVKIRRNKINVGPYVSKNIALKDACGEWITGHDADDWAHPQRLEKHIEVALSENLPASLTYMVRMQPSGLFGHIGKVTNFSFDGVARKASISCLFKHNFLREQLGFWDSVRFGADSEMIERANHVLGGKLRNITQIGMICLDLESSLTNHPKHGVHKTEGISPIRANYRTSWSNWHKTLMTPSNAYLDFLQANRRYVASPEMIVPTSNIKTNSKNTSTCA